MPLKALMDDIDDWCGTGRKPGFPPKGHAFRDLLVAVAIHDLAAQVSDPKVREQLQGVSASVVRTAAKGLGD